MLIWKLNFKRLAHFNSTIIFTKNSSRKRLHAKHNKVAISQDRLDALR